MGDNGKDKKKQDLTGLSRRHKIAIWTAIATAIGGQGIPKIVELLENKPSTEQVQTMIAHQTATISKEVNKSVDALVALDQKLSDSKDKVTELRASLARVQGAFELLQDVFRDCCTPRRALERLKNPKAADTKPVAMESVGPLEEEDELEALPKAASKKTPEIEMLKKVPEFNVQQQLQIQGED